MAHFHVYSDAHGGIAMPRISRIEIGDLYDCLRAGWADFMAKPSHIVFTVILYPLIGVVLAAWTSGANMLPMLFPLASGFALLGPLAAIGLYEVSRRRELGMEVSWRQVLEIRHSPALPSIAAVGVFLFALFIAWLLVAQGLYTSLFGAGAPASHVAFIRDLFGTERGWSLILYGNLIGLVFAAVVISTTVIAFPLLLDRDVGAASAIAASVQATLANPGPIAVWGVLVALLLALGSVPLFAGLIVVFPVIGHATWHLYRKLAPGSLSPGR